MHKSKCAVSIPHVWILSRVFGVFGRRAVTRSRDFSLAPRSYDLSLAPRSRDLSRDLFLAPRSRDLSRDLSLMPRCRDLSRDFSLDRSPASNR